MNVTSMPEARPKVDPPPTWDGRLYGQIITLLDIAPERRRVYLDAHAKSGR